MAHAFGKTSDETDIVARPNRPDLDGDEVWHARVELAACFRFAARLGMQEGICNHFSLMVPGYDDLFLVNPYGKAFAELTASDLLVCDFDGNVVSGSGNPRRQLSTSMPACTKRCHGRGQRFTPTCPTPRP